MIRYDPIHRFSIGGSTLGEMQACEEGDWVHHSDYIQAIQDLDHAAKLLCDAMRWVYVCRVENQNRADMIARFEALELTPANQTPPKS